jgi:hypothetical protein
VKHLILCLSLFLSACVTMSEAYYGKGPLPNRDRVAAAYEQYKKSIAPGAFFVADNGSYGYSYCEASVCSGSEIDVARYSCLQGSRGVPCWMYARGLQIVWDEKASKTAAAIESDKPQ